MQQPNAGLSDSESRIVTRLLELISGPLHLMIEQKLVSFGVECERRMEEVVDRAVDRAIDRAFHQGGSSSSSGSFRTLDSNSSNGSHNRSLAADHQHLESHMDGLWVCPFCLTPLKDEHSFDEHLKKVISKLSNHHYRPVIRRSLQSKRAYCVFDPNDQHHRLLISPWKNLDPTSNDAECCRSFIFRLRSLLTPGAHAVFLSGTGHIHDVHRFIDACVHGVLPE
jgi:hypothetical protein